MKSSDKIAEVSASLFAVQRDLKNPATDKKADTGKFSYPYLSLPALIAHARKELDKVGLAIIQEVTKEDGGIGVTTRILHLSGEWLEMGPLWMPAAGTPQNYGSAITYGRRYALAAALGIAAEEDDDAASLEIEPAARPSAGSSEGGGMVESDGSEAPASDPTSGAGVSDEDRGEGSTTQASALLITPEQIEVLKVAAGGVQKARAASKATYSKDWRELTADEALKLIQQLQALKEAS